MSELGGFVNIILAISSIIILKYNDMSFMLDLANQLYEFKDNVIKKKPLKDSRQYREKYQKLKRVVQRIKNKDILYLEYRKKQQAISD